MLTILRTIDTNHEDDCAAAEKVALETLVDDPL